MVLCNKGFIRILSVSSVFIKIQDIVIQELWDKECLWMKVGIVNVWLILYYFWFITPTFHIPTTKACTWGRNSSYCLLQIIIPQVWACWVNIIFIYTSGSAFLIIYLFAAYFNCINLPPGLTSDWFHILILSLPRVCNWQRLILFWRRRCFLD